MTRLALLIPILLAGCTATPQPKLLTRMATRTDAWPPEPWMVAAIGPMDLPRVAEMQRRFACGAVAISGRVALEDGTPLAGVTITASGDGYTVTTTTDSDGRYIVWVPVGWSGTVTPSYGDDDGGDDARNA